MTDRYDELDDVVESLVRDLDDEPITIPEAEAKDMLLEDPFLSMLTVTARQALDGRGRDAAEIDLTAIVTTWVNPDMLPTLAAKAIVALAAEQREHMFTDADLCAAKASMRDQLLTTRFAEIQAAITDPGAIVPRIDDAEMTPAWCARAVVAVLAGTQAPTLSDDSWAALDEVLSPIVAAELARQADEQAKPQVLDLDTVLAALESDIAAMPSEAAIAALVRRVAEPPDSVPMAVDAVRALADERGSHAMTRGNFDDYTEVAEDWRAQLEAREREGGFKVIYRDGEDPYLECPKCGDLAAVIERGDTLGELHADAHEHCELYHQDDPHADPGDSDPDDEDPLAYAG